jgi:hypothetical protein
MEMNLVVSIATPVYVIAVCIAMRMNAMSPRGCAFNWDRARDDPVMSLIPYQPPSRDFDCQSFRSETEF